ncbi:hypothetical protein F5J12DRAFT_155331 [Pisolithus orientalis]|uniref:uncharacterized protein n=1 Tax=Pisolithus orientalis TaxID=936130 RepID=UPI002225401F|nr:uncharacterized protein F5J12DRAFT_155331 [Pisolithus orientalis]KAI6003487.1 hypothetical protein F5J12DRAFT_155331 [Pisolithus orientalis]
MKCSTHLLVLGASISTVLAQSSTWCGKNYMANQTVVPPGGQFALPSKSDDPLLAFRCAPAFRPYLQEDAKNATFVVDTRIVYDWISGASPITLPGSANTPSSDCDAGNVTVVIEVGGLRTTHEVPLNATGYEVPLDISKLSAQQTSYNVSCSALYLASASKPQVYSANTTLLYLPNSNNSVTKTDLRTGSLWVRPVNSPGSPFQPFVPQGFYVSFDPYLLKNLSYIDQLKDDGFNTIHPVPPYDNATVFEQVLNRTVELGLYVIFDMRSYYQNLTAVAELVNTYKSLPNLLTWETAHEPDGNSDPLSAAKQAYDLIYQLDGYHPIGIVLNCEDYDFTPYVEGADIVLEDAYPIGINATYSLVWHTPCTPDFGHCGCDDCKGGLIDIKARIQTYKDRLDILGYDRTKTVWTTPQAVGNGAYWTTIPTGAQWAAIGLISFNHGATGSMSYQYPTTTGNSTTIEGTAMILTNIITEYVQPYLVRPQVAYSLHSYGSVDAGVWYDGTSYLLIAANVNGTETFVPWGSLGLGKVTNAAAQVQARFSVGQPFNDTGLTSTPTGVGIYTVTF